MYFENPGVPLSISHTHTDSVFRKAQAGASFSHYTSQDIVIVFASRVPTSPYGHQQIQGREEEGNGQRVDENEVGIRCCTRTRCGRRRCAEPRTFERNGTRVRAPGREEVAPCAERDGCTYTRSHSMLRDSRASRAQQVPWD